VPGGLMSGILGSSSARGGLSFVYVNVKSSELAVPSGSKATFPIVSLPTTSTAIDEEFTEHLELLIIGLPWLSKSPKVSGSVGAQTLAASDGTCHVTNVSRAN